MSASMLAREVYYNRLSVHDKQILRTLKRRLSDECLI
jgi:hypothetical protein